MTTALFPSAELAAPPRVAGWTAPTEPPLIGELLNRLQPPPGFRYVTDFFVPGIPRPGGSKTATVIRRKGGGIVLTKDGRPLVTTREAGKYTASWRADVKDFARKAYHGEPVGKGIALWMVVVFQMPRPGAHFGSGRNAGALKVTAPDYRTEAPDATKLMRALEDALTGTLWADDAQIVASLPVKVYAAKPGATVRLFAREGGPTP